MKTRILPSITTHSKIGGSWRNKIEEIQVLGLTEVALFVTGLSVEEREACYKALLSLRAKYQFEVPFVHAVSSMREDEFWLLHDTFGTEAFNLHPSWDFPLEHYLSDAIRSRIFIENSIVSRGLTEEDLDGFAGLCLDLSHLEESKTVASDAFFTTISLAHQAVVGACHISAIQPYIDFATERTLCKSLHHATTPEDFAYLFAIPEHCFSPLCAIELENSLAEQVKYIPTIAGHLGKAQELRKAKGQSSP